MSTLGDRVPPTSPSATEYPKRRPASEASRSACSTSAFQRVSRCSSTTSVSRTRASTEESVRMSHPDTRAPALLDGQVGVWTGRRVESIDLNFCWIFVYKRSWSIDWLMYVFYYFNKCFVKLFKSLSWLDLGSHTLHKVLTTKACGMNTLSYTINQNYYWTSFLKINFSAFYTNWNIN